MASKNSCELCMHYDYDEEYECYQCRMNFDEDEMMRFLSDSCQGCPYFQFGDEYKIVRKQI